MTNQDKFKLVANAFPQNFVTWNQGWTLPFGCNRAASECKSCILNGSNHQDPGICLGSAVLNDTSLAAEFFDQYPEYLI